MRKRILSLLVPALLLLAIAPPAMATHCWVCRIHHQFETYYCDRAYYLSGWTECEVIDPLAGCILTEPRCTSHGGFAPPLATEFTIVSVERIDEPTAPPRTQLAALPSAR